ncbi:hypothetical protein OG824_43385 [Streptomyces prunicolor]|uniref:hypothetical protein n=1 Tax=Streptomyces prunicolor TaxID=67348 RepID=UPI0022545EEE|nr:hypothetical protein [Streptomyces prunicolor]MCX5242061.1 hypothetical protein [Streptomyces prunicolor]
MTVAVCGGLLAGADAFPGGPPAVVDNSRRSSHRRAAPLADAFGQSRRCSAVVSFSGDAEPPEPPEPPSRCAAPFADAFRPSPLGRGELFR